MGDDRPRHNLPTQLTSFVGREPELAAVRRLLAERRLLTLVGPPGVGKTRLALEAAGNLISAHPDGVWLVELAALADPALVPHALAAALAIREQPGHDVIKSLVDALRQRQLLLILDNCEHLIEACAALAEYLLRACPDLTILATSREPLGIPGETTWPVPTLTLPTMDDGSRVRDGPSSIIHRLLESEAAQLFVDRAGAVVPGFALCEQNAGAVLRICWRLDGIPLAIELAAARVRGLAPDEIAARLDDRLRMLAGGGRTAPPRHRTLRSMVDWSYALLSESERVLFRRVSVFSGGWTLDAAEEVCGGNGVEAGDVLDLLLQLVARSLVLAYEREGHTRYRLLETLREYGLEKLGVAEEEASVRNRHLNWFAGLARLFQPQSRGPKAAEWMDRLTMDHDNFRAALSWSLAEGGVAGRRQGLRLAGALSSFWFQRDHLTEGSGYLERVLAADTEPSGNSDVVPGGTASSATEMGERHVAEEGHTLDSGYGTSPRIVALNAAASLAQHQQRLDQADVYAHEALELAHHDGDSVGIAFALGSLGNSARIRGQHDRAITLHVESLRLSREVGHPHGTWRGLNLLGETLSAIGDLDGARPLYEECLAHARDMQFDYGIAEALRKTGFIAFSQGELDRASVFLEESVVLWRNVGATRGPHWSLDLLGQIGLRLGDLDRAASCFADSLLLCRAAGDRQGMARCLEGLAMVAAGRSQPGSERHARIAARLSGAADALREEIHTRLHPDEHTTYEQGLGTARVCLGEPRFAAAWAEGRASSLEEALELALSVAHGAPGPRPKAEPAPPDQPLTAREQEVTRLIARGLTNHQIAAELVVADRTVDAHIRNILGKLGFASRAQVAAWAAERGLTSHHR